MLAAVLDTYIVWHPDDTAGRAVADTFIACFHGDQFTGLLGGAIEVYVRSRGWRGEGDAPRPIPLPGTVSATAPARYAAVVPLLGNELAFAVESAASPWGAWLQGLLDAQAAAPERIGIYPLALDPDATNASRLGTMFNRFQQLARPDPAAPPEPEAELRCRDLAQALAQLLTGRDAQHRICVFISHTKRASGEDERALAGLIDSLRRIIACTRLAAFFDANDLQPGEDWDQRLRRAAGHSALLALRTDRYASRDWCQREMAIAKRAGMPIVVLESLARGEERGSFLLDHVARVPVRHDASGYELAGLRRGLNLLVSECLKHALWREQEAIAREAGLTNIAWWSPHAPEPVTFARWLGAEGAAAREAPGGILILHPEPPLTREEQAALHEIAALAGIRARLDVLTPRTLAARGGG
ncbi:MAG TPA: toll/interleukin-1 receptor domain-containing protein [Acetobacteraceae bacterium]|nr:toll/interleukin-1 receptor domain-containing protein [Acetobacteraceae bacterium]